MHRIFLGSALTLAIALTPQLSWAQFDSPRSGSTSGSASGSTFPPAPPQDRVVLRQPFGPCESYPLSPGNSDVEVWRGEPIAELPRWGLTYCAYRWVSGTGRGPQRSALPSRDVFDVDGSLSPGRVEREIDAPVVTRLGAVPEQEASPVITMQRRISATQLAPELVSLPEVARGILWPFVQGDAGWAGEGSPRVRVVVLDTASAESGFVGANSDHALRVARLASAAACGLGHGLCDVVRVEAQLAMPLLSDKRTTDYRSGGYLGTRGQLALALKRVLDTYDGRTPLVLNLSLGWHGRHDSRQAFLTEARARASTAHPPEMLLRLLDLQDGDGCTASGEPQPVETGTFASQAVMIQLLRARCAGALTFAAAGNAAGGDREGAVLPAGWNSVTVPAGACETLGFPRLSPTAGPQDGPLVHAVGAIGFDKRPLATSRYGSRPRLNAVGMGWAVPVNPDPSGGWLPARSGTSLSTALVSGVAARMWAHNPALMADEVTAELHAAAASLPNQPAAELFALDQDARAPEAKEVTVCSAPLLHARECQEPLPLFATSETAFAPQPTPPPQPSSTLSEADCPWAFPQPSEGGLCAACGYASPSWVRLQTTDWIGDFSLGEIFLMAEGAVVLGNPSWQSVSSAPRSGKLYFEGEVLQGGLSFAGPPSLQFISDRLVAETPLILLPEVLRPSLREQRLHEQRLHEQRLPEAERVPTSSNFFPQAVGADTLFQGSSFLGALPSRQFVSGTVTNDQALDRLLREQLLFGATSVPTSRSPLVGALQPDARGSRVAAKEQHAGKAQSGVTSSAQALSRSPTSTGSPRTVCGVCTHETIGFDALWETIQQDFLRQDVDDQPFTRYITLSNKYNAGVCPDAQMDVYRNGLNKALNSLSDQKRIVRAEPIDSDRLTYRIDTRDYGWDQAAVVDDGIVPGGVFADKWEAIVGLSPYAVQFQGDQADQIRQAALTDIPMIYGDALIDVAEIGNLYYALVNVPDTLDQLLQDLGVNREQDRDQHQEFRAGTTKSSVSRLDRIVTRNTIRAEGTHRRGFWQSFDFLADVDADSIFVDAVDFVSDSSEAIFTLSNGLLAYAIYDGLGKRQEEANTLFDTHANRSGMRTVASCSGCHARGLFGVRDEVAQFAMQNRFAFNVDDFEDITDHLYDAEEFARGILFGNLDYSFALKQLSPRHVGTSKPASAGLSITSLDPVLSVVERFNRDLDLDAVAGDLGVHPGRLRSELPGLDRSLQELGSGGTIRREDFTKTFQGTLCQVQSFSTNRPDDNLCDALISQPVVATAVDTGDRFGVASATGDFDGDGFADLAVGVSGEGVAGQQEAGAVNVIYGSRLGLERIGSQIWHQDIAGIASVAQRGDHFGSAVAVGDFDNDGFDDLAVGAPGETIGALSRAGAVNVIYGGPGGLSATDSQLWNQDSGRIDDFSEAGDLFGSSLTVGDFNGDGFQDLAAGVPGEAVGNAARAGAVNVIYGGSGGLSAIGDQFWHQDVPVVAGVSEAGDLFGSSVAAGDFDGDGVDDLAAGAPGEAIGSLAGAGAVNVLYGGSGGLGISGNQVWHQGLTNGLSTIAGVPESGDLFGSSVAAGDFDGDGVDDLAAGAPGEAIGSLAGAGAVNVLYGGSGGLGISGNQVWHQGLTNGLSTIAGVPESGDLFGSSVAAGDFDGDGVDDLAAGAPGEAIGSLAGAGAVNVLYGGSGGLGISGNQVWHQGLTNGLSTIAGVPESGDLFGSSVAAGDFDGDGVDDLAAGVPGKAIRASSLAGAVNTFYGTGNGLSAVGSEVWHQAMLPVAGL